MTIADRLHAPLIDENAWREKLEACAAAVDEDTRIAVAAGVLSAVRDHAIEGGSFRHLIYERMGFSEAAYLPLFLAGGMDVSNEFLMLAHPEKSPAIDALQELAAKAPMMPHPTLTRSDGSAISMPTEERLRLFAALHEFRDVQAALLAERHIRDKVEAELGDAVAQAVELRQQMALLRGNTEVVKG